MLGSIATDCVAAGAWMVGHIKANVRSNGELLSISSTTVDGNVRRRYEFSSPVNDYSMTVNVIVYGTERRRTAEILADNIGRALGDIEMKIHSEIGCEDPACRDPACRDDGHDRIIRIS